MNRLRIIALLALGVLAACAPPLPQDRVARAARCAAATQVAMTGESAEAPEAPAPFARVNAISHYFLLAGLTDDGGYNEMNPASAMTMAAREVDAMKAGGGAPAVSRQCRRAYPAVSHRGPIELPTDDLLALAGCYQLAVMMGDFYATGGKGHIYAESVDVGQLMHVTEARFSQLPAAQALSSQADVEDLMRRGLNFSARAGPPHDVLRACEARVTPVMG